MTWPLLSILVAGLGVAAQSGAPATFQANPSIGGGAGKFKESAHFRIYNAGDGPSEAGLKHLEAAYHCLVTTMGWRSSGLSNKLTTDSAGPFYKTNIYAVATLGNAAGQMFTDARAGLPYVKAITREISAPRVVVHEWGHAITFSEKNWVDMKRTGAWWEPVANWVADTYMTSPLCEASRKQFGQTEGRTIIELPKIINGAAQVLVDASKGSGNYYQSWPFITYITNNPDKFPGIGKTGLRDMIRKYKKGSNETPLHALERVAAPAKVQAIVGRYWARMAYVDIGHAQAQRIFQSSKGSLRYNNLDASGSGSYTVKAARQPKYMGANINPLKGSGAITVKVTASTPFTATLAIRASGSRVRYVDLPGGAGKATLASGEEASLVVANTPALINYDAFAISGEAARGLSYKVQLTGATA